MIYKDIELSCTQEELDNFIANINITSEVRGFSELYNSAKMENPTNDLNAKYVIVTNGNAQHILTHDPQKQGFVAITDLNETEVIESYKQQIIDNMIFSKFAVTEEDKQEQRIAELEAAIASIVGGAM